MALSVTIDPPLPTDSPATFNAKAFAAWASLSQLVPQLNDLIGEFNGYADTASTKAGEASASATAANNSKNAAAASATAASGSASTASTKATEAAASATAASTSASTAGTKASDAAGAAATAATKANEASASAATATGAVTTATTKATEAASSATSAAASATTATTKAADASSGATTATTKATEATAAAATATAKAAEAVAAAGSVTAAAATATTKATEAANSAAAAAQSAIDAQNAAQGEPAITKSTGYATWTGSAWLFKNETYLQTSHPASGVTSAKITNWDTAYGWGNHASAGYASSSSVSTALAGKSDTGHTHTIANVTGLQTALDGKQAASSNLTGWSGKVVPSGAIADLTSTQTLSGKTFDNYSEKVFAITDSEGVAINPANGPIQTWTLGANRTPNLSSIAAGQSVLLAISSGSYVITWSSVVWPKQGGGGTAPALATSGVNHVVLWRVGSQLYGAFLGV